MPSFSGESGPRTQDLYVKHYLSIVQDTRVHVTWNVIYFSLCASLYFFGGVGAVLYDGESWSLTFRERCLVFVCLKVYRRRHCKSIWTAFCFCRRVIVK